MVAQSIYSGIFFGGVGGVDKLYMWVSENAELRRMAEKLCDIDLGICADFHQAQHQYVSLSNNLSGDVPNSNSHELWVTIHGKGMVLQFADSVW